MSAEVFLSGGALLVSLLSLAQTMRHARKQSALTDREIELVRINLQKEHKLEAEKMKANVSANYNRVGAQREMVRIFNLGPAKASNIRVFPLEATGIIMQSEIDEKLPIVLERGATVDLMAGSHMGSKRKEDLKIVWDDPSGVDRVNTVTISL